MLYTCVRCVDRKGRVSGNGNYSGRGETFASPLMSPKTKALRKTNDISIRDGRNLILLSLSDAEQTTLKSSNKLEWSKHSWSVSILIIKIQNFLIKRSYQLGSDSFLPEEHFLILWINADLDQRLRRVVIRNAS